MKKTARPRRLLAEIAKKTVPPPVARRSWRDDLTSEQKEDVHELRDMFHRGELQHDSGRAWTVSELRRFVITQCGLTVTDNAFRAWVRQGASK